jgi:energy-coupling factor transporter transmembrane protein EcfT
VKKNIVWPLLLVVVFALSRWPGLMPPNFSAAYAIVFCAGLYLPGRLGWIVPLAVLAGSDLVISLFFYRGIPFSWQGFLAAQCPNYLAYAGLIWLGRKLGSKRRWWMLLGGGIAGAILFYLVTNTASWITLAYAKTLAGWIQALTTGFPAHPPTWEFFRNTLLSGGLFTGLFVAAMKLTAESKAEKEAEPADEEAEAGDEQPEGKPAGAEN